ncbi:MAG TPA: siroheme synthase CysG [Acidobacteriaceae bacterium]|nr:siroheme synthase CysG [Acidobacteriaceae bacterium]
MSLFPAFIKLARRPCLLVGAGAVALEKIGPLLAAEANLRVVAPSVRTEIQELADAGQLQVVQREWSPHDLDNTFMVIAATDDPAVNAAVYESAVERNILCNSVDDPPHCDFYFGSIVTRGDLQIAISTAGESPALAQRLRKEIDAQLPEDFGAWLAETGRLRREVLANVPPGEDRKLLLHRLAQREVCGSAACEARSEAFGRAVKGRVYLVGAGPGDPDLLTTRAARLLATADVVLTDDLVPGKVLWLASAEALAQNVGKRCGAKKITQAEINALMISNARSGRSVVRLKSGDPLVFGRAAEEIDALREAAVEFEVVPGITSAFAAAAALGLSLTDRRASSIVQISSGHHATGGPPAIPEPTRVVYMPGKDFSALAAEWRAQGLPGDLPCAAISHAAQPDQRIIITTLDDLDGVNPGPAPVLVVAGWVLKNHPHSSRNSPNSTIMR